MTVSIINNFYKGESSLNSLITSELIFQKGFYAVCFSEINTILKPEILTNSIIEIDGNFYKFNSDESISGSPSSGVCYVKCYLSGSSLVADFSNTDPDYDFSRRGYYGTGATENHRYILKLYFDGTNYLYKQILKNERLWRDAI